MLALFWLQTIEMHKVLPVLKSDHDTEGADNVSEKQLYSMYSASDRISSGFFLSKHMGFTGQSYASVGFSGVAKHFCLCHTDKSTSKDSLGKRFSDT